MLWSSLIDVVRGSLFVLAHWCGGSLGAAILLASAALRLAMMPLTLRSARRHVARERAIAALAPEVQRLKTRYPGRPDLIAAATQKLYAANGITAFDTRSVLAMLPQLPVASALYAAIRGSVGRGGPDGFLWVKSLARPDRGLALLAGIVTAAVTWASATAPRAGGSPVLSVVLAAAVSFIVLSRLGAGLALYAFTNSIIAGLERMLAQKTLAAARA